jgi:PAS domain S-box-containing protein
MVKRMNDKDNMEAQLTSELAKARRRIADLEKLLTEGRRHEALEESDEKFKLIFEKSADPTVLVDGETFIDCNEAALELMHASSKEQLIGLAPYDISPERQPDGRLSREKARELISVTLKNGVNRFEWMRRTFDGEDILVEVSQTVIPINGKPILYTAWRDIRERKKAEAELRDSEERYRVAIENSNDGVALLRGSELIYANQRLLDIFGYDTADEVIGRPVSFAVHPDDAEGLVAHIGRRQKGESVPPRYEFRGIRRDGAQIHVEASITPITYLAEPALLVYIRDVTRSRAAEEEKSRLESQLRQAQKMEAVGQLAGGIAHDFNNILMVISGFCDMLNIKMDKQDPAGEYVDQIISAAARAAKLTKSLLAFSRKQQINLVPLEMNDIARSAGRFLETLLTEDVQVETMLSRANSVVMADMTQMNQVLINLATNARDAMPKGGRLRIEAGTATMDRRFIVAHGFGKPGRYATLEVSDTGSGMDKATKEHAFEPFFTTKEVGKGTGLGLSMVYGTIKQHDGYITVDSEPNQGTRFCVYLPLVEIEANREVPLGHREFERGSETILIAEDDAGVRGLVREAFRVHGYKVIEAADGEEAVRTFVNHRDKIDLVILDVVMPRKGGKEAYDELKKIRPETKVIFASGYPGDVLSSKGILSGAYDFVTKPLAPGDLLKKVREVLDRKGEAQLP